MRNIYKCILVFLLLGYSLVGWGQNLAGDWFADFSLGMQTPFTGGTSDTKFGYQTTPYYSIGVGNWLSNEYVLRLKVEGSSLRSCYQDKKHDTDYLMAHVDLMPSIANLFTNGNGKWDILPYVGLGYYHGFKTKEWKAADMLSVHFGVKALWQIQPKISLFLEGGIAVLPDGFDHYRSKRNQEGIGSLALGITWKWSK